mmetsp:Transcript_113958/g.221309  ORF Transcript_113958/g.221309 Transcript_113958/m.221309 type:complete len:510 (+) Transcript_113958:61-1590(+)
MRKHTQHEEEGQAGDGAGLWESILRETATEARSPDAHMLLLGRPGVGKRTLVQSLLQHACPKAATADAAVDGLPEGKHHSRAVALDYAYFGARDPAANDEASANDFVCPSAFSVVILEDAKHEGLLRSRLSSTAEALRHMVAVVCLDLKEPWTMMEDLRSWIELLQRLMSDVFQQLELGDQDSLRARNADTLSAYSEPKITDDATAAGEPATEGDQQQPGNDAGAVLTYNLGIPLIVAVTRADGASALETQKTVGWSETIEAYLRSECLSYGAAIVYTMVQAKNVSNVDVLYEYLMHRIYDFPLKRGANLPSRDALFIPSGYDTQAKVDGIVAAMPGGHGLERSFESVVVSLEPPKPAPPQFQECKNMQEFLKESAMLLPKTGAAPATAPSSTKAEPGAEPKTQPGQKRSSTDSNAAGQRASTLSNRTDGQAPAAGGIPPTDNTSLANFFQTLLTRGQKEGGARQPMQTGGSGLPADAALNATKAAAPNTGAASAPAPGDAALPATGPS